MMPRASIRTTEVQSVDVWRVSTAELAVALTTTLGRLSPARASIVADQLRELLRAKSADRLIALAASESSVDDATARIAPRLIAIALLPDSGDTATIVHVDWCDPSAIHDRLPADCRDLSSPHREQDLAQCLWQRLEAELAQAGIRFVQWATDPVSTTADSAPHRPTSTPTAWAPEFEFSQIGTLEYLTLDCDRDGNWISPASAPAATTSLFLQPLDHTIADQSERFLSLVERTYVDSLDCPSLSQFCNVHEIVSGYQTAAAYAPDLWFTVLNEASPGLDAAPIGCLLLARHAGPAPSDGEQANPASVLELVYMGIAAEHRGQGFGQQIMRLLSEICQQQRAERLILAVDQENHPAIAAYRRAGMRSLFRETVWGRLVAPAAKCGLLKH